MDQQVEVATDSSIIPEANQLPSAVPETSTDSQGVSAHSEIPVSVPDSNQTEPKSEAEPDTKTEDPLQSEAKTEAKLESKNITSSESTNAASQGTAQASKEPENTNEAPGAQQEQKHKHNNLDEAKPETQDQEIASTQSSGQQTPAPEHPIEAADHTTPETSADPAIIASTGPASAQKENIEQSQLQQDDKLEPELESNNFDSNSGSTVAPAEDIDTANGSRKRSASGKLKSEGDSSGIAESVKHEDILIGENQKAVLAKIINSTRQHKDAGPFLEPVDPVLLEIPDYTDIVKHPMDLATVKTKLENNEYNSLKDFASDVNQIFENCFLYNGKDAPISSMAKQLKKYFANLLSKHNSSLLSATHVPPAPVSHTMDLNQQMKLSNQVLKELFKKQYYDVAVYFYEPVDHVALNIPDYPKIIKHPMDLGTVRNKLANNEYLSSTDFYNDVKLIFQNCYKFNHKKNPVHIAGKELEAVFDAKWSEAFGDSDLQRYDKSAKKRRQSSTHSAAYGGDDSVSSKGLLTKDLETPSKNKRDAASGATKAAAPTNNISANANPNTAASKRQSQKHSGKSTNAETEVDGDLTIYEKQQLSTVIETLPPERLLVAFDIIQSGYPVVIEQKEEIELDIDVLDFKTLRRLYDYVVLDKESA